jgi:hypothetical protein
MTALNVVQLEPHIKSQRRPLTYQPIGQLEPHAVKVPEFGSHVTLLYELQLEPQL